MEKKLTLLLADDDSDDRELFEEVLKEIAPEVELFSFPDGKDAIAYLTRIGTNHLPCAVILDYNMPHFTAPQVLEWICSRSWFDGIHKFVWSTSSSPEHIAECKDKGAMEYFVKPPNHAGIEDIIHHILEVCELGQ